MTEMTHDRCSELLPLLLAGRLDAEEALEVEHHLEGCPECRAELRGLTALASDLTPLTDFERVKLRRAVRDSLPAAAAPRASIWSKAAPFISVAAALLILGFGLTSLDLGGTGSGDESGGMSTDAGGSEISDTEEAQDGPASEADGDTTTTDQIASDAAEPEGAAGAAEALEAAEPEEETAGFGGGSGARGKNYPVYKFGGQIVPEKLESQARTGRTYRSAALALKPENVHRDREDLLATLRGHAEKSGRSGENLETCARTVTDSSSAARLPVFATFGKLETRPSLAIGFIEAGGSTYNRYLIGIWSPPTDCTDPRLLKGPLP